VQNRTKVAILITNGKLHTRFRLAPKWTTMADLELNLNGYYALSLHYMHVFRSQPQKNSWKQDPNYQQQKCSPGILVYRKICLCGHSRGFAGQWASNENEVVENGHFRSFARYILELSHSRPRLLCCRLICSPSVAFHWHWNKFRLASFQQIKWVPNCMLQKYVKQQQKSTMS